MSYIVLRILQYRADKKEHDGTDHGIEDEDLGIFPFISSPVVPEARRWLQQKRQANSFEANDNRRASTVEQFEAERTVAHLAGRIFHKQHAASSLELFFDLFFVANLAVFTDQHTPIDASSIGNYIGFFSIIWSTWFNVSIYDVRFYTDSLVNKMCKLVYFGIMTSLVTMGKVYETTVLNTETTYLQSLALLMMTFRFVLAGQYLVVLYFVRGFQKSLVPLLFMIGIYSATGIAFLVLSLVDASASLDGGEVAHRLIHWYIILGIEALSAISTSSVWRILSFKHTHLVERLGLLTLIVIGEGILGMVKSLASMIAGADFSMWTIIGNVEAAVTLMYIIYLLYFNNIDHHRFGSIRQQIWALLHYMLHVAILLTVEGQAALTTWSSVQTGISDINSNFPSATDPASQYNSSAALAAAVRKVIADTTSQYNYADLSDYYNATIDLANLENANSTSPFGSHSWNTTTAETLNTIKINLQYFIFQNFQAEGPEAELAAATNPSEKVSIYNNAYGVVFEYFFIAAGGLLLMLAVMLWFGKVHKHRDDYANIVLRVAVGMYLPCMSALAFLEKGDNPNSFRFSQAGWIVGIVTLSFAVVLIGDNLIKTAFRRRIRDRVLAMRNGAHGDPHHHPHAAPAGGGHYIKMDGISEAIKQVHSKSSAVDTRTTAVP